MASEEIIDIESGVPENHLQVCRLCLSEDHLEDVFDNEKLHRCISDFLSIMINKDQNLSHLICAGCRTRLEEFKNYEQRCLNVQHKLNARTRVNTKSTSFKCSIKKEVVEAHCSGSLGDDSVQGENEREKQVQVARNKLDEHSATDEVQESTGQSGTDPKKEKKYKCKICPKTFIHQLHLHAHSAVHKRENHACTFCSKRYRSSYYLEKHLLTTHDGMGNISEQSNKELEQHKLNARTVDSTKSTSTTFESKKQKVVEAHWSGSDSKEYLGDDSVQGEDEREKVQVARNKLVEHNATDEVQKSNGQSDTDPKKEKKYKCKICPKTFIHQLHLHAHSAVHKRETHACKFCSKRYRSSYYLEKHLLTHEGMGNISEQSIKELPTLTCSICGKVAQSSPHLLYHMQTQHDVDMESDGVSAEPSTWNADDLFEIEEIKVEIRDD